MILVTKGNDQFPYGQTGGLYLMLHNSSYESQEYVGPYPIPKNGRVLYLYSLYLPRLWNFQGRYGVCQTIKGKKLISLGKKRYVNWQYSLVDKKCKVPRQTMSKFVNLAPKCRYIFALGKVIILNAPGKKLELDSSQSMFCRTPTFGFFMISKSDRKSARRSVRQIYSGRINLLKMLPPVGIEQQPSLI